MNAQKVPSVGSSEKWGGLAPERKGLLDPNILSLWQPFSRFHFSPLWRLAVGSPSKTSVWSLDLEGGFSGLGGAWDGGFSKEKHYARASFSFS